MVHTYRPSVGPQKQLILCDPHRRIELALLVNSAHKLSLLIQYKDLPIVS